MKILITGSDGYIGTQMSQYLIGLGYDVEGIDSGFYREGWLYNTASTLPKVRSMDIRSIEKNDLVGYDVLIHLADLSNDPLGELNEENTYAINHKAVVRLVTLAKEVGIKKFIYSSSCSIYGIATDDLITELSQPNPQTAYAKCKLLVENDLKLIADNNFCVTFLRNATVYGPSPRMRFDLAVNNLCGCAYVNSKIILTSDGTPWRPFVHILDVCEAFKCVIEADSTKVNGEIFNVGNNKSNYRIKDVAEIIAQEFPNCEVALATNGGDTRSYKVSFDKINSTLPNYSSKRTVEDGVSELKNIFSSIKMTTEVFEHRAYTRLKELDHLIKSGQVDDQLLWKSI